jgi:hypothetical protein
VFQAEEVEAAVSDEEEVSFEEDVLALVVAALDTVMVAVVPVESVEVGEVASESVEVADVTPELVDVVEVAVVLVLVVLAPGRYGSQTCGSWTAAGSHVR